MNSENKRNKKIQPGHIRKCLGQAGQEKYLALGFSAQISLHAQSAMT